MSSNNSNSSKQGSFAASIAELYEPLNANLKFKEKFKDDLFKILLNPKDGENAALIQVDKGVLTVKSIDNSNKKNIDQKSLGWDALMQTTIEIFSDIGSGKLSSSDIVKKVVTRKIKVKNPNFLTKLTEMGNLLRQ
jgi:putative sterol carrier protein